MKKIGLLDISTIMHTIRHRKDNPDFGDAVLTEVSKVYNDLQLDTIVAIQDFGGSRFRKDSYEAYKAHRKEKELTVREEEKLKELTEWNKNLHLFNAFFPSGKIYGVEADDIIGILYWELRHLGYEVTPITIDKDFLSSIPCNDIYNWKKGRYFNLEDAHGFTRTQFLLFQGLLGDDTDNIKGICGEKTAIVLVRNFKSYKEMRDFEGEIDNLIGVTRYNRRYVKKALEDLKTDEAWENLKLSYSLVKIFKDTSHLNETEYETYLEIKDNILTWEFSGELDSDLEMFMWENDCPELAYRLEKLF